MRGNTLSPSDLNNFLDCEHLVSLELQVARGEAERPQVENPQADLIRRKGEEHEAAYLASLRATRSGTRAADSVPLGILDVERNFTPLHAHDHATERAAFEGFIDLVRERLTRFPDLHVYHYAQYEITALRRLMGSTARARPSSTTCCDAACSSICCASCGTDYARRGPATD